MKRSTPKQPIDYVFLTLILLVVGVGLVLLSSASSVLSFQKFGNVYYYLTRQVLYGLLPGLVLLWWFSRFDYHRLARLAVPGLVVTGLALVAVLIPHVGVSFGGASRWLQLGGFSFQPSELAKLTLVLYLAWWLDRQGSVTIRTWRGGVLPFVILLAILAVLLMLQPDMGTMVVLILTALVVFFAAGASLSTVAALIVAGGAVVALLIKVAPYRLHRLTVFLHPELDPQGIGYHINQALLAVGSGGFWGEGLGHSRQKYQYLPEVTGDSIFAVVAEELGFVLTTVLLAVLIGLVVRGYSIARRAPDQFGRLLAFGIISWLAIQIFVNIAAMLNLIPLTGIPLPFISQGGTALAVTLLSLGIMLNISRQARNVATGVGRRSSVTL